MNALKNMEITFVAAAIIAIGASFVTAGANTLAVSASGTVIAQAADSTMPVVTVSARRLTAAEKAAFI
jgi:2-methylaconitate cis-trans-isomerase PrpF